MSLHVFNSFVGGGGVTKIKRVLNIVHCTKIFGDYFNETQPVFLIGCILLSVTPAPCLGINLATGVLETTL